MWKNLKFQKASLMTNVDGSVWSPGQDFSNPRQIRIKNKRDFFDSIWAFQGVTLSLSFTRVKNLPRVVWSNFIVTYLLCLFLWSFDFRRMISVLGARWPLAAKSRIIATCDPWPKAQEPLSPRTHSIAWKRTDWPTWVTGWNVTNRTALIDSSSPLDWHLPLYGRVGVPLPNKGEEMLTRPKQSYSPIFAAFF